MRDEGRWNLSQRRTDAPTGTIGRRRAWTVSMISALSILEVDRGDAEVAAPELALRLAESIEAGAALARSQRFPRPEARACRARSLRSPRSRAAGARRAC
jgi:hypothetical protein